MQYVLQVDKKFDSGDNKDFTFEDGMELDIIIRYGILDKGDIDPVKGTGFGQPDGSPGEELATLYFIPRSEWKEKVKEEKERIS